MSAEMEQFYEDPAESRRWGELCVDHGLYPVEAHLVTRHFRPGTTVLDIGSGGGREAFALAAAGFDVTAIDNNPAFVETCEEGAHQRGLDIVVMEADAAHLPFDDEQFDHVVMVGQLLGHIRGRENRVAVLREIGRVMKPGLALISTNAIERRWIFRLYFAVVNWRRRRRNPHNLEPDDAFVRRMGGKRLTGTKNRPVFHWYRTEELVKDVEEAGWTVVESLRRNRYEKKIKGGSGSGETFYLLQKDSA
ncbi:MAG: class I SAM-dependent methyltransferase [Alphaproteobacteria bacterium]